MYQRKLTYTCSVIALLMHMPTWTASRSRLTARRPSSIMMFTGKGTDAIAAGKIEKPFKYIYLPLPGDVRFYATIFVYNDKPLVCKRRLDDGTEVCFEHPERPAQVAIGLLSCKQEMALKRGAQALVTYLEQKVELFHQYKGAVMRSADIVHELQLDLPLESCPVKLSLMFPNGTDFEHAQAFLAPYGHMVLYRKVLERTHGGTILPSDFYAVAEDRAREHAALGIPSYQGFVMMTDLRQVADMLVKVQYPLSDT